MSLIFDTPCEKRFENEALREQFASNIEYMCERANNEEFLSFGMVLENYTTQLKTAQEIGERVS